MLTPSKNSNCDQINKLMTTYTDDLDEDEKTGAFQMQTKYLQQINEDRRP